MNTGHILAVHVSHENWEKAAGGVRLLALQPVCSCTVSSPPSSPVSSSATLGRALVSLPFLTGILFVTVTIELG